MGGNYTVKRREKLDSFLLARFPKCQSGSRNGRGSFEQSGQMVEGNARRHFLGYKSESDDVNRPEGF